MMDSLNKQAYWLRYRLQTKLSHRSCLCFSSLSTVIEGKVNKLSSKDICYINEAAVSLKYTKKTLQQSPCANSSIIILRLSHKKYARKKGLTYLVAIVPVLATDKRAPKPYTSVNNEPVMVMATEGTRSQVQLEAGCSIIHG